MSFMPLLEQRTSVMVRESIGRSCGYLMSDMQALVESQQSGMFSLPYNANILVMNNRCLIQVQLTFSRVMVFLLVHNPAVIEISGNSYMRVNCHLGISGPMW